MGSWGSGPQQAKPPTRAPPSLLRMGAYLPVWVIELSVALSLSFTWALFSFFFFFFYRKLICMCVMFEMMREDTVTQIRHKKWVEHLRPASYNRGHLGSAPQQQWQSTLPPVYVTEQEKMLNSPGEEKIYILAYGFDLTGPQTSVMLKMKSLSEEASGLECCT